MKKICWITADNFIDVDMPILPLLQQEFNISWYVKFRDEISENGYSKEEVLRFSQHNNINCECIQFKYRLRDIRTLKDYFKLFIKIKRLKPDIIYIDGLGIPYLFFVAILFFKRKKIVFAIHDVISHVGADKFFFLNFYKKIIMTWCKNIHIFSNTQKTIFLNKYKNKNILNAPLALKDFGKSHKNLTYDSIRFLFFGSIRENKGLEFLIQAVNKVVKMSDKPIKICIAGNCNSNWLKYEKLIEDHSVYELIISHIPNSYIPDLFKQAHFLVLPYKDVTQSGPLLIAYNYNIPVIASDHDGFKTYIDNGVNGFLFENSNVEALIEIMLKAISLSKEEYSVMKNKQNEYTNANLSIEFIGRQYSKFFNSICF